jgi:hypothetical protein
MTLEPVVKIKYWCSCHGIALRFLQKRDVTFTLHRQAFFQNKHSRLDFLRFEFSVNWTAYCCGPCFAQTFQHSHQIEGNSQILHFLMLSNCSFCSIYVCWPRSPNYVSSDLQIMFPVRSTCCCYDSCVPNNVTSVSLCWNLYVYAATLVYGKKRQPELHLSVDCRLHH